MRHRLVIIAVLVSVASALCYPQAADRKGYPGVTSDGARGLKVDGKLSVSIDLTVGTTVKTVTDSTGTHPIADWCVSSVWGDDNNDGKCDSAGARPFKTIAKLLTQTITAGQSLVLFAGSTWHEQLTVPVDNLKIVGWGVGAKPLLDGSDPIAASAWSLVGGTTKCYQATVTTAGAANSWVNIYENGKALVRVANTATCDSTAGSQAVSSDVTNGAITIYVHPSGDTNPGSDGKIYEFTARQSSIYANGKVGLYIENVWTRRNLSWSGSIILARATTTNRNTIRNVLITDGNDHALYIQSNTDVYDTVIRDGYWANAGGTASLAVANDNWTAADSVTYTNMSGSFTSNSPVAGTGFISHGSGGLGLMRYTNCSVTGAAASITVAQAANTEIIGGSYVATATHTAIGLEKASATLTNVKITTTGAAYGVNANDGGLGTNLNLTASGLTVSGDRTAGANGLFFTVANSTLNVQNSSFAGFDSDIVFTQAGANLYSRNNTFSNSGKGYYFGNASWTLDSDYNTFPAALGMYLNPGNYANIAAYRAAQPTQDTHSTVQ